MVDWVLSFSFRTNFPSFIVSTVDFLRKTHLHSIWLRRWPVSCCQVQRNAYHLGLAKQNILVPFISCAAELRDVHGLKLGSEKLPQRISLGQDWRAREGHSGHLLVGSLLRTLRTLRKNFVIFLVSENPTKLALEFFLNTYYNFIIGWFCVTNLLKCHTSISHSIDSIKDSLTTLGSNWQISFFLSYGTG